MTTIAAPPCQILANFARFGHGIDEFPFDSQIGKRLNGACTQTSLECCIAAVEGRAPSQANVVRYVQQMRSLRDAASNPLAAANGAATLEHTAWYAQHVLGKGIATQWDYHEPLTQDWLSLLRAHAGVQPILMQVAYGLHLIDAETKAQPEAAERGLRYHAIAVVGKQGDGYIVCDPDNLQVTQRFQIYTRQTLEAAVPCGLLMLAMPSLEGPPPPHPLPLPNPPHPLPPDASDRYKTALAQIETLASAALKG